MSTRSVRIDFSYTRLYAVGFSLGLALAIAATVLAAQGHLLDPMAFLNDSLRARDAARDDWFALSVKAAVLALGFCVAFAIYVKATRPTRLAIDAFQAVVYKGELKQAFPTSRIQKLDFQPKPDGSYRASLVLGSQTVRFSAGSVLKEKLEALVAGAAETRQAIDSTQPRAEEPAADPPPLDTPPPPSASTSENARLLRLIEQRAARRPSYPRLVLLALVAVAFVVLGGVDWGLRVASAIALALCFHELGHLLAMKAFRCKNLDTLLLPFLGALVSDESKSNDGARIALVSLAGPIAGTAAGTASTIAALFYPNPWLLQFAIVSFLFNGFKLLPFKPLDGGLYLNALLFARFPASQLLLDLVALPCLAVLAWTLKSPLLGVFALFLVFGTPTRFAHAKLARRLRNDERLSDPKLDASAVAAMKSELQETNPKLLSQRNPEILAKTITQLWRDAKMTLPDPWTTAFLALLYPALLAYLLFALGFAQGVSSALGA